MSIIFLTVVLAISGWFSVRSNPKAQKNNTGKIFNQSQIFKDFKCMHFFYGKKIRKEAPKASKTLFVIRVWLEMYLQCLMQVIGPSGLVCNYPVLYMSAWASSGVYVSVNHLCLILHKYLDRTGSHLDVSPVRSYRLSNQWDIYQSIYRNWS